MGTITIRLHRVLAAPPERVYRAFLDAEATAKWLPPHGFTARVHQMDPKVGGQLPDLVHELHQRPQPRLRRRVPRAGPARTDPLHRSLRRPEPAGRDGRDGPAEEGVLRHRARHRPGRHPGRDPGRELPPRLAAVAGPAGAPRRTRDPRLGRGAPASDDASRGRLQPFGFRSRAYISKLETFGSVHFSGAARYFGKRFSVYASTCFGRSSTRSSFSVCER